MAFPTIGLASAVAADFLAERLQLAPLGFVHGASAPAAALVRRARPAHAVTLHAGETRCGAQATCTRVVLLTSLVPLREESLATFATALRSWARERGIREIVVLEGFTSKGGPEQPELLGLASTDEGNALVAKAAIPLFDEGILHGLPGVLLAEAADTGQPAYSLFTKAREDIPDARAAARLVEAIDKLFVALHLDTANLQQTAVRLESTLHERAAATAPARPPEAMYG